MLNFQVACAQKFQIKNDSFLRCRQIWNVLLLICENSRKNGT